MDWDQATFLVGLLVLALQGIILYIQTSLKLWAVEKFVTKKDFLDTLTLWHKGEHHV